MVAFTSSVGVFVSLVDGRAVGSEPAGDHCGVRRCGTCYFQGHFKGCRVDCDAYRCRIGCCRVGAIRGPICGTVGGVGGGSVGGVAGVCGGSVGGIRGVG